MRTMKTLAVLPIVLLLAMVPAVAAKPKAAPAPSKISGETALLTPQFPLGTRILFQGDSITDGGRGYGDDPNHIFGQDYAYLIAANCGGHFPDKNWTFLNRGISGNKVTDLAGRWQGDALSLKPDILSILVGVNDAASV
ncbi:MAG: GDSL-type esterase/lipase family protein, partial [Armatimonadota bacterium]|nr:GDSL-type esterase/lipase family protein [Armatimonadota bacterium]